MTPCTFPNPIGACAEPAVWRFMAQAQPSETQTVCQAHAGELLEERAADLAGGLLGMVRIRANESSGGLGTRNEGAASS